MNFPNLLLVFSSLLGRNDEKNGTDVTRIPKIDYQTAEGIEIIPNTYESSSIQDEITASTFPSKEMFPNQVNSSDEIFTSIHSFNDEHLRTKNCSYDENCSMYDNCCEDFKHLDNLSNHKIRFSCVNTPLDGKIYMIQKCPSEHANLESIYKCETSFDPEAVHDISLILPVTSSTKNITYRNSFCAVCNNETSFEIWDPVLYYELSEIGDLVITDEISGLVDKIHDGFANQSMILSNLKVANGTALVSEFNNLTYKCTLLVQMPSILKPLVRYCRSNVTTQIASDKDGSAGKTIYANNLIKLDRNNLPQNLINPEKEVNFTRKFRNEINNHVKTCVYSATISGDACLVNSFFLADTEVVFMKNDEIYVKKYNATFDQTEYTNETSLKNIVYVCGTELPDRRKITTFVKVFLSRFSTFCILLLLIMNAKKKKLQSLSDKMTYAYCITMLLVYGAFEMHRHPSWCLFTEEAMHYFFLSHFIWFLAMSYELWNVICRLSVKFQSASGKSHTKRFVVYCLICWITPLPVIPLTMYYRRFVNIPTNCPSIPGYKIRQPCLTIPESPIGLYVFFINSVIICINVFLFAHVCYHIYLTKRRNVKSTSHNNYFELFVKLALTMDLQWFFYLFSFSDIEGLKVLNTMLNASHGLITFLAYGVKKSTFVDFYKKYRSYFDVFQKMRNTFVQLFGDVKRVPFLKRHSVEPSTQHTGLDNMLSDV
ncbi:uncharacterized protein LOC135839584 [Planococcus citri]|uniref:uncharacterized protein LOC135839584 n=1 Tax=Planococcus citri TaxID=170843 RepID=UPI0031F84FC0